MLNQTAITGIVFILFISIVFGVIFSLILKTIFLLLGYLYSFLSKYSWFAIFTQYIIEYTSNNWQKFINWWRDKAPTLIRFFEYSFEVFGDIIVLGLSIGVAGERFNNIQNIAEDNPQYSVLQILESDMITHPVFWGIFIVLLSFWIIGKSRKYTTEKNTVNTNQNLLADVSSRLEKIDTNITAMSNNIKKQSNQIGKLAKSINKLNKIIEKKRNEL